jgi:hypothetical protein
MSKLQLAFPLKTFTPSQYFGNPDPIYFPLGLKGHNGIDCVASHGTPVYAMHDGRAYYEIDTGQGHGVVLVSNEQFELADGTTSYIKSIYWHLVDSAKEPSLKSPVEGNNGISMKTGDLIGYSDNTGMSSGDHLHIGCKPVAQGEGPDAFFNTAQNNGFLGAIDPFPYLPRIKYYFGLDLHRGMNGWGQVADLQHFLYQHGYMPLVPYDQGGIYGPKTAQAVLLFQEDNWKLSLADKLLNGNYCGPKTRGYLNQAI